MPTAQAAPAPEAEFDSPYIGSEGFDDEMSPEEQALYDAEMNEDADDFEVDSEYEGEPESTPEQDQAELETENAEPEPEAEPEAEPEPEAAATEEAEPEPETPEVPHETQPDHRIPKARLDREMAKRKELEQKLAALEADRKVEEASADDTPIELTFDAEAITKALDMNLDGKNSEAAAILIEQFQSAVSAGISQGRSQMRAELDARTDQAVNRAVGEVSAKSAEQAYSEAVASVEADYAIFNPDSGSFDPDMANKAVAIMNGLQEDGTSPGEALREAAELTLMRYRPELLKKDEPAPEAAKAEAPAPTNAPTAQSRQRNAAAAAAQPNRQAGKSAGTEDSKVNLEALSEEEFDALPDSVLAELRGDLV